MILYLRVKELVKCGEAYKETIKEKRYFLVDRIKIMDKYIEWEYLNTSGVKDKDICPKSKIINIEIVR